MVIAIRPDTLHDVWLDCDADVPRDQRTVFHARCMTFDQAATLADFEDHTARVRHALTTLVESWENWRDAKGVDVPYDAEGNWLAYLKPHHVIELWGKVELLASLTEDERGKSGPSSTASTATSPPTASSAETTMPPD